MKDTIILLQAMKERLTEQKSIGSVDIDIINQAIKELKSLEILKKHIRIVKPFDLETKKKKNLLKSLILIYGMTENKKKILSLLKRCCYEIN